MPGKISSLGRKYSKIVAGGILTAIGSGLVVFFAGLFTDVTQLKAQVNGMQDDKIFTQQRLNDIDKKFDSKLDTIQKSINDIHGFLIEGKRR